MFRLHELKKLTSGELINLLAGLGYGKPFCADGSDKRCAFVYEYGKFNGPTVYNHYAKIVVSMDNGDNNEMFDYGVRVFVEPFEFDVYNE